MNAHRPQVAFRGKDNGVTVDGGGAVVADMRGSVAAREDRQRAERSKGQDDRGAAETFGGEHAATPFGSK
jgi:hypothetical protein